MRVLVRKTKAHASVLKHQRRKRDGPAIWSLQLRGRFAQLLAVEREFERAICAPAPGTRSKFEHATSAINVSSQSTAFSPLLRQLYESSSFSTPAHGLLRLLHKALCKQPIDATKTPLLNSYAMTHNSKQRANVEISSN